MPDGTPQLDIQRLVHDHHADVYRYARRLVGQVADAEDLVQQTFLTAQRKLGQLREANKTRAWLLAITRTCFLKSCGKRRPTTASSLDFKLDQVAAPAEDLPIDAEALQRAIQELPDAFRVVVLMFYFEYLSYREISEELEVPVGTVMSRLCRAKKHLRSRLLECNQSSNGPCIPPAVPMFSDSDRSLEDSKA
jgi:RNA polymerase sigma-70 factor (ECF subfamily)